MRFKANNPFSQLINELLQRAQTQFTNMLIVGGLKLALGVMFFKPAKFLAAHFELAFALDTHGATSIFAALHDLLQF